MIVLESYLQYDEALNRCKSVHKVWLCRIGVREGRKSPRVATGRRLAEQINSRLPLASNLVPRKIRPVRSLQAPPTRLLAE